MTWFMEDDYLDPQPIPRALLDVDTGPRGLALVDVYAEGRTSKGWALTPKDPDAPGFMANYMARKFWAKPRVIAAERAGSPFAIVTRSANLVVLDIDMHDGGEDGVVGAVQLGDLPPTLAETSKSGDGRHLFYSVPEPWDDETGFGRYADVIGIAPGVDLRSQGCVYHYASQRWNNRPVVQLPDPVIEMLELRTSRKIATTNALAAAAAGDPDDEDVLIMHHQLLTELNKPIGVGKRNNTLFAIGSKMKAADYPNWQDEVQRRAGEVGVDSAEADKIISNIDAYA